jgi:hypothetical protein
LKAQQRRASSVADPQSRMNFLKQRSSLRILLLSATTLLCAFLGSVLPENGASRGLVRTKPAVELQVSKTLLTHPCQPDSHSISRACPSTADLQVALTVVTKDFNKPSVYAYAVSGGRIVGEGSKVTWDLSAAGPGLYAVTVEVQDNNKKHRALSTANVTVQNCEDCVNSEPCPAPIVVTCYDEVKEGTPITCKVVVGPAIWRAPAAYEWSARDSSGGDLSERISRQGIYVSIPTNGLAGQTVYATVKVKGLDPSCSATASGSTAVKP